jgi:hypothetical protein
MNAGARPLPHDRPDASGPVARILDRLDGVRRSGRGWIARCPAHADRSASLSLAAGDDGRVLLRCFAGCSAAAVVHAIGLELADLFPERLPPATPEARRELRERATVAAIRAAIDVLSREALIVRVAAEQVRRGVALADADALRLDEAIDRIEGARAAMSSRGVHRG